MPSRFALHTLTAAAVFALAGCAADSSNHAAKTNGEAAAAPAAAPAGEENFKPGQYAVVNGKKVAPPAVPMGDPATVKRIIDEGTKRNQVMTHLTYLTQNIGPRLTGSTNLDTANKWTRDQFASWGYDATLHEWGTVPVRFDRGPSTARIVTARETDEGVEYRPVREMDFTTLAWGKGTDGPVRGRVVKMPTTEEEFKAVEDKLKGSWVLIKAAAPGRRGVGGFAGGPAARMRHMAEIRAKWAGEAKAPAPSPRSAAPAPDTGITRYEGTATGGRVSGDVPLLLEVNLKDPAKVTGTFGYPGYKTGEIKNGKFNPETKALTFMWEGPGGDADYTLTLDGDTFKGERKVEDGVMTFSGKKAAAVAAAPQPPSESEEEDKGPSIEERVLKAAPAGFISASGDDRVRTGGMPGWREMSMDKLPQDIEVIVRQNDYDYMNSRIADGQNVTAEFDLKNEFKGGPFPAYNTVAEIKGTTWPDEIVIVSGHLDSWNGPGSQGCTDNGTGSSVTLEAARILMAAKAKPKRTIRFILWGGEEQGLLGSREYVNMLKKNGELEKVSAVFVDDGGTNSQGGLRCVESQVEYLAAATAPVNGLFQCSVEKKPLEVNVQPARRMGGGISGGSSDHAPFLAVGVPAYFWDEVGRADYGYGWHTQHDKLDLAIPEYLMQSATCSAVTAYNLACAPTMLARPEPAPPTEGGGEQRPQRRREQPAN